MSKPPEPPESAFHAAARTGRTDLLADLIAQGADINEPRDLEVDNGSHLRALTPLMVAARSIDGANVDTLRWLLDHGADLKAQSEGGETAAYYAAGKGGRWEFHPWTILPDHVDRLRFLLDAGLDPNETNCVGRSLLVEACEAGDPARVKLLLERGAAVSGGPAVERAVAKSPLEMFRELAPDGVLPEELESMAASLPPGNPGGRVSFAIPLFCAAMSGSAECVRTLLQAGADLNERDGDGKVALMYSGSAEVVDALVDAGADANGPETGEGDVISVLISGAACTGGLCSSARFDVIRALIARGAQLHRPGKGFCQSRLQSAAFRHDAEAVEFLLSLGARAAETDDRNHTALHAICWQGEYTDPETNARCEQIVRALVAAGADVNAADASGNTPLHEAAGGDWGNQTAVRALLELGANPDPVNNHGFTPLMSAAGNGDAETVRLLLAAGADPKRQDPNGLTAGWHAMRHLQTWEQLVQNPPQSHPYAGTAQEQTERHREALAKAQECDALFDWPPRPGQSA